MPAPRQWSQKPCSDSVSDAPARPAWTSQLSMRFSESKPYRFTISMSGSTKVFSNWRYVANSGSSRSNRRPEHDHGHGDNGDNVDNVGKQPRNDPERRQSRPHRATDDRGFFNPTPNPIIADHRT